MRFGIIGTGNAAHHFVWMLVGAGHRLCQVCGRADNGFASRFGAEYIPKVDQFDVTLDLVILAVNDDAIASVSSDLSKSLFAIHLSGMTPLNVLTQKNHGVVWPIQSLSSSKELNYKSLPLLIEANNEKHQTLLKSWFAPISNTVVTGNFEQRVAAHVSAVFVNNFVNHLYDLTADYMKDYKLSFNLMMPIVREEMEKISVMTAEEAQTGPARRGDIQTLKRQMDLLEKRPHLAEIYQVLTNSILRKFHGKEL